MRPQVGRSQVGRSQSRQAQKRQTRQALLDAALTLMADQSFGSIGIRQLTREVGIASTGFYRHFPDLPALGVSLVEESLGSVRTAIRAVRLGLTGDEEAGRHSVDRLVAEVDEHRAHFRFIARESHGGTAAVRAAIQRELRLVGRELAVDLRAGGHAGPAGPAGLDGWSPEDVSMLADLVVDHTVLTAAALLEIPPTHAAARAALVDRARRQSRLIAIGARRWTPLS